MAMTEADWLTCSKATMPVMKWLRRKGSDRKFYLVAAAAVRNIWHMVHLQPCREAVEIGERYADGLAGVEELNNAFNLSFNAGGDWFRDQGPNARRQDHKQWDVYWAASYASWPNSAWQGALNAMIRATLATSRAEQWPWQCAMLRDIFGNPFRRVTIEAPWLAWNNGTVPRLAQTIYDQRRFEDLPILADALEEAGCTSSDILDHCRSTGPHVRGCWIVDLVLKKK